MFSLPSLPPTIILLVFGLILLFLMISWWPRYSFWGALLSALSRGLWLLPLLSLWVPQQRLEEPLTSLQRPEIAVFVDDSASMQKSRLSEVRTYLQELEEFCQNNSCTLEVMYGSELEEGFLQNLSPLDYVLPSWWESLPRERPYLIFSDGGATTPRRFLTAIEKVPRTTSPAMIIGWWEQKAHNISLGTAKWDYFGFATQPFGVEFPLYRSEISNLSQALQIQVSVDGKEILRRNVSFEDHSDELNVHLTLPPLDEGNRSIHISVLPLPGESELWDNELFFNVDILAHTIGVLHLQGSPHGDGRFLRRFLKNDPRFEVISFFILRDPWDLVAAKERELSLIPFPVDQLFGEELPHFQVVVMQNFRLSEFLSPEHQNSLLDYVKQGGSLLFLGGPRAFHFTDLHYTPLQKMLPFDISVSPSTEAANTLEDFFASNSTPPTSKEGLPWYDSELTFQSEEAPLTPSSRSLPATALHQGLGGVLAELKKTNMTFKGLHHMDQVKWHSQGWLPVWQARISKEKTWPLISASYVGSGRAIWVFSDALWQLAMATDPTLSRDIYNQLFYEMFRWLSRDEKNPPLSISDFSIKKTASETMHWSAVISGTGVDYLFSEEKKDHLKVSLCQNPLTDYQMERLSQLSASMSGTLLNTSSESLKNCWWFLEVSHGNMGKEELRAKVILDKQYTDSELSSSAFLLKTLAQNLGAQLIHAKEHSAQTIQQALLPYLESKHSYHRRVSKVIDSPYEFFHQKYLFLLLLFMPLEVLLRKLFSRKKQLKK